MSKEVSMADVKTYAQTGVDYSSLDPIKVLAQQRAAQTAGNLKLTSAQEISESRGESAYVWEENDAYRALVVEGLGTKNLVADQMRKVTGKTYYNQIAQDTVAMIVNDLVVVGAMPQVVNAYFAVGDSAWMNDQQRASDLINGWASACDQIGATWGGGETPTLKGIIEPDTIDLGGSAIGIINPKKNLILGDKLTVGDEIVLIESSGIHANGITFVRHLAKENSGIYSHKMKDGRLFGEAILTPTHLYVDLVRQVLAAEQDVHYMVNITGHGWRKLMRANKDFSYVLDKVLDTPEEFNYMQELSGTDDQEMYGNFNMGAGFAFFVASGSGQAIVDIASRIGLKAEVCGLVENGPKQVKIIPKNIVFASDSLEVRQ
jgi:phosphoribosylformylglycinamidine cyclo-ligase